MKSLARRRYQLFLTEELAERFEALAAALATFLKRKGASELDRFNAFVARVGQQLAIGRRTLAPEARG